MAGEGEKIGAAYVEITADTSAVDRALEGVKLEITSVSDKLEKHNRMWREGQIGWDAYSAGVQKLGGRLTELRAKEEGLTAQQRALSSSAREAAGGLEHAATATVRVNAGMSGVKASGQTGAMGLLQLSNAIDDVQYGFRGVVNNIPGIVMGFGAGAGIAGVAQIAAVGVNMLVQHWDDLEHALGLDSVKTAGERMEQLGRKTHRTAEEQREYNRLKKEEADIEEMMSARTEEQGKTSDAVKKAIAETGGDGVTGGERVVKGVLESRKAQRMREGNEAVPLLPEEQERIETLQAREKVLRFTPLNIGGRQTKIVEDAIKKIRDAAADREFKRAQADVAAAADDPAKLRGLVNEVRRNPGAFPRGLAERLQAATPEGRAAEAKQKEAEKAAERIKKERAEQDHREVEEHNEEVRKRREAEAKAAADAMHDRLARRELGGEAIGRHDVFEELRKVMPETEASEIAGQTLANFRKDMDAKVRRRQLELGADDAGAARADLLREMEDKAEKEDNNEWAKEQIALTDKSGKATGRAIERHAKERERDAREQSQNLNAVFGPDIARDLMNTPGSKERADAIERARVAADLKRAGLAKPGTEEDVAAAMVADARRRETQMEAAVGRFGPGALQRAGRSRFAPRPKRTGRGAAANRARMGAMPQAAADGRAEKAGEAVAKGVAQTNELLRNIERGIDAIASI